MPLPVFKSDNYLPTLFNIPTKPNMSLKRVEKPNPILFEDLGRNVNILNLHLKGMYSQQGK